MLVKLKRDWFDRAGHLHRANAGMTELPDDYPEGDLPRDAVVLSKSGSLPSTAVQPQPGFGAKPAHEQTLDLIPHAAPTHVRTPGGEMRDAGIHPDSVEAPTEKELEAREKERQRAEADAERDREKRVKEEQGQVTEGLQAAKKKEDAEAKAAGDPTRKSQIKI